MKDNHKATKFFVDFYRLASLLQYNNEALYRRAYLTLPKRIKDEMVHFHKTRSLDRLRDLIQKIDQCYWECKGELLKEILLAPKQDPKNDWSNKSSPNPCQNQAGPSNSHLNQNPNSNSKEKEKPKASTSQPKKTDISDKLGKDGKLTPQERQHHFDNKLCLVCGQGGHIMMTCLKAKPCAAKASLGKANEAPAESMVKASKAKN